MSHAPPGTGSKADPNLTPLLDVVLQLLMFFIVGVKVVGEQLDYTIQLPPSQTAVPRERDEADVLFLNLAPGNKVYVLDRGRRDEKNLRETRTWLETKYDDKRRLAKDEKVNTAIVIRAHQNAQYSDVYQLLKFCREVGFQRLKVRALTKVGGSGT